MHTVTLGPLRWQERSARVRIVEADSHPEAYFQITGPKDVAGMAKGRPVEELPRIVGILSPSHHIVSAMALDKLFKVEPPALAVNMREAYLKAEFFRHHLRKLYFFLSAAASPFREYRMRDAAAPQSPVPDNVLDEIMYSVALAQEAAAILGGRADHPVSAVAGGVGRFLKEPHYGRLAEIAETCVVFAASLARILRDRIFSGSAMMDDLLGLRFPPMQSLAMGNGTAVLRDPRGKEIDRIAQDEVFDKIGLHPEPWSYEPFAFLTGKGWGAWEPEKTESLYFVGPLARLSSGEELSSPRAEAERQSLIQGLGAFPHFSAAAAYWSLVVEAIQAAEALVELSSQERLTGPAIRTIPSEMGVVGYAALESPEGLIAHRYQTDDRAIVEEIGILDTAAQNNALHCFLVRKAVEESFARNQRPEETKSRIELGLLPF